MLEKKSVFNSESSKITVLDMVQVSLMAAIIYISTAVINVPSHMGVIHLGDSMVFVAAVILGKKKGAAAAAVGMCLFDLLSPYAIWAPFTFVIKGTMAFIAGSIAYRKEYEGNGIWNNALGFVLGGIWMIGAYYLAGVLLLHFYFNNPLNQSFITSLADIPGNVTQVIFGIVIALPLSKLLKKSKVVR